MWRHVAFGGTALLFLVRTAAALRHLRWARRLPPLVVLAFLNSAWVTWRRGGIRWRDTFYPLDTLRKGGVR